MPILLRDPKVLNQTTAVTAATTGIEINDCSTVCFQAVWGAITGTLKVQTSNDNSNWTDESDLTITSPTGTAGNTTIHMQGIGSAWIRMYYTHTSGTGSLVITFVAKDA